MISSLAQVGRCESRRSEAVVIGAEQVQALMCACLGCEECDARALRVTRHLPISADRVHGREPDGPHENQEKDGHEQGRSVFTLVLDVRMHS